jgi:hypothetical protein
VGIIQTVAAAHTTGEGDSLGQTVQRIALRSFLAALALLAFTYVADFCVFRYRVSTPRQAYGTVAVEHYTAVAHKDGRAELIFDPPVQETCVHSLFPHGGNFPCWYLTRHTQQETDI